ncbi:MAG: hypothetical protein ABR540_22605 [Acidimicrobiales bacterium]
MTKKTMARRIGSTAVAAFLAVIMVVAAATSAQAKPLGREDSVTTSRPAAKVPSPDAAKAQAAKAEAAKEQAAKAEAAKARAAKAAEAKARAAKAAEAKAQAAKATGAKAQAAKERPTTPQPAPESSCPPDARPGECGLPVPDELKELAASNGAGRVVCKAIPPIVPKVFGAFEILCGITEASTLVELYVRCHELHDPASCRAFHCRPLLGTMVRYDYHTRSICPDPGSDRLEPAFEPCDYRVPYMPSPADRLPNCSR